MPDRDRLAADLHDIACGASARAEWDLCVRDHRHEADRLIALGWTRRDRLGACECSICDDHGAPCPNHSDICANCHRDCWGSVYPLDVERLARAINVADVVTVGAPVMGAGWDYEACRIIAAAIAAAYEDDRR